MINKNELIKQELLKYSEIFVNIEEDKKPFVERLYKQAAFMSATLDELQEIINTEGAVITSVNGNGFETTSEHPAQKSYNTMIKNYNATIKSLIELLPEDKNEKDELTEFLQRDAK